MTHLLHIPDPGYPLLDFLVIRIRIRIRRIQNFIIRIRIRPLRISCFSERIGPDPGSDPGSRIISPRPSTK
ncbi:unnamed protein product [Arabidopsis halleri]